MMSPHTLSEPCSGEDCAALAQIEAHARHLVRAEGDGRQGDVEKIQLALEAALRAGPPSRTAFTLAMRDGSDRLVSILLEAHGSDIYRTLLKPKLRMEYCYTQMLRGGNMQLMERLADAGILTQDDVVAIADHAANSDHPEMLKLAARLLPEGRSLTSWIPAPALVETCGPRVAPLLAADLKATALAGILAQVRGFAILRWKTILALALAHPGEKIVIPPGVVLDSRAGEVIERSQSAHGRLATQAQSRLLIAHLAYGTGAA